MRPYGSERAIQQAVKEASDTYAVILAGGWGTRLWPLSRRARPKQFLKLMGNDSMLQVTVSRLRAFVPISNIMVATLPQQLASIREELPELPTENVVVEPVKRGTGPSLAYVSLRIEQISPEATILVVSSDHLILDTEPYIQALAAACQMAATTGSLVTVGLPPASPVSNYGYILKGEAVDGSRGGPEVFRAIRFVEKPAPDLARQLYDTGAYLWNSGTFAWSVTSFHAALQKSAPQLAEGVRALRNGLKTGAGESRFREVYASLPDISIDYALLERADDVLVVEGQFKRVDVGDLSALAEIWPADEDQNAGRGTWIAHESQGNVLYSSGPLLALVGVDDMIVIATEDVVLICAKDRSQSVGRIVQALGKPALEKYR